MDLLDRYVQAVKWWLPKGQKDDIIAELSEDIRSEIEEKEAALGRKLEPAELEAILGQRGNPALVAGRYLRQEYLIGPRVFPFYRAALKGVFWFYLVPWLLVWGYLVAFVPGYRARYPGLALIGTLGAWWEIAVYSFAIITVVFAIVDRRERRSRFLETWNPRHLPPVRDPHRIPRSSSIAELMLNTAFIAAWVSLPRFSSFSVEEGSDLRLTLGAVWQSLHGDLFFPVLLLLVASVALSLANLLRPQWTPLRLSIRAVIDGVASALLWFVLAAHWLEAKAQWAAVHAPPGTVPKIERAADWINLNVYLSLAITAFFIAVQCLVDAHRIFRWRTQRGSARAGLAALAALVMLAIELR